MVWSRNSLVMKSPVFMCLGFPVLTTHKRLSGRRDEYSDQQGTVARMAPGCLSASASIREQTTSGLYARTLACLTLPSSATLPMSGRVWRVRPVRVRFSSVKLHVFVLV